VAYERVKLTYILVYYLEVTLSNSEFCPHNISIYTFGIFDIFLIINLYFPIPLELINLKVDILCYM
jgi:hypothetical protein